MKRFLGKIYDYWLAFGHAMGMVTTPIFLGLVYVVAFGGSRLVAVARGLDPLDKTLSPKPSFWYPKPPVPHTVEETRHQF